MLSYPQWKQLQRVTGALTVAAVAVIFVAAVVAADRLIRLGRGARARELFENSADQG